MKNSRLKMPLVSVIIAAYNVERYIDELMESLLNQTYPNIEILAMDDGSSDDTGEILESYSEKYENVKVYHQANVGLAETRNNGMKIASGKYIAFVDGDDVVPIESYYRMVESLEGTGSEMATGFVQRLVDGTNRLYDPVNYQKAMPDTIKKTSIRNHTDLVYDSTAWNKLYNREFMLENGLFYPKGRLYEDIPVEMAAHVLANSVDVLSDYSYKWRIRGASSAPSITQNRLDLKGIEDRLWVLDRAFEAIAQADDTEQVLKALRIKVLNIDLYVHMAELRYHLPEFIEPYYKLFANFVSKHKLYENFDEISVRKQLVYRMFLTEDFSEFSKYADPKTKIRYTVDSDNNLIIANNDIDLQMLNSLKVNGEVSVNSRVQDYEFENGVLKIAGFWHIKDFPKEAEKTSSTQLFAQKINSNEKIRLDIKTTSALDAIRFKRNYEFEIDFNEIDKLLTEGSWRFEIQMNIGDVSISRYVMKPKSGGYTLYKQSVNGLAAVSRFNKAWQLTVDLMPLNVENLYKLSDVHVSLNTVYVEDSNLILSFIGNEYFEGGRVKIEKAELDFPIVLDPDRGYIAKIPFEKYVRTRINIVVDRKPGQKVIFDEYDSELNGEVRVIQVPDRLNVFEYIIAPKTMTVSDFVIKDGFLNMRIDEVAETVSSILATSSDGKVFELKANVQLENVSINLFDTDLDPIIETGMFLDVFALTKDDEKFLLVTSQKSEKEKVEYSKDYYRISVWKTRFESLRIVTKLIWTSKFDLTKRRRKVLSQIIYPFMRLLPLNKKLWVFTSYWGQQYSSNERAIYEFLSQNYPDMKSVWFFTNPTTKIKGSAERVRIGSLKYYLTLARAKYIVQNTNMPQAYLKRDGQIEIETLHGTFMKTMGFDEPGMKYATRASKRHYDYRNSRWDYIVSPSKYMDLIAPNAFRSRANVLQVGFPRNDRLINDNNEIKVREIKNKLGVPLDKKIILYAPTWRTKGRFKFELDIDLLRKSLESEYILLTRLHHLAAKGVDFSEFDDFVYDESNHDNIEDLYLISDVMITDYSSVMFDYALLDKPMIFFAYDLEWYLDPKNRGTYIDYVSTVPGPIVKTTEEIAELLLDEKSLVNNTKQIRSEFRQKYASYGSDGDSSKRLIESVINVNSASLTGKSVKNAIVNKFVQKKYKSRNIRTYLTWQLSKHLALKSDLAAVYVENEDYLDKEFVKVIKDFSEVPSNKMWIVPAGLVSEYKKILGKRVTVIAEGSLKAATVLAQAKFVVFNSYTPDVLNKRAGQKFVSVWLHLPVTNFGLESGSGELIGNQDLNVNELLSKSSNIDVLALLTGQDINRISNALQVPKEKIIPIHEGVVVDKATEFNNTNRVLFNYFEMPSSKLGKQVIGSMVSFETVLSALGSRKVPEFIVTDRALTAQYNISEKLYRVSVMDIDEALQNSDIYIGVANDKIIGNVSRFKAVYFLSQNFAEETLRRLKDVKNVFLFNNEVQLIELIKQTSDERDLNGNDENY
ncbi:bifunctional glycosyltransferase/CDP-glycerol:glycerophosphate glycerophosphotransferase [Weissella cibaria]|uniref:bifunctional glycosyltransferase/CDP-glycerol:glycerophosphate glycerophosphotransferase n=1 Tax=Weissella cibaria TaxID=137591 RepID=UPI001FF0FB0E|nr:bifunctional glycosyltransferase/CDP-glycerol:glycerophosphate glycerophosphotransferase [Weissella cibaria]UOX36053.1 CDP-glycerol glycerophosphotransferase family protein [Weissella cibaria]